MSLTEFTIGKEEFGYLKIIRVVVGDMIILRFPWVV